MTKISYLLGSAVLGAVLLTGCKDKDAAVTPPPAAPQMSAEASAERQDPMMMVLKSDARGETAKRDPFRNPKETLEFFGLGPNMTVVEIWPGGGWYANILAPYADATNGSYIAALFAETSDYAIRGNAAFREKFPAATTTTFSKDAEEIAPAGTADMVLSFRNVHNWMSGGYAEKAFADFHAALKPGGTLGIVEHRLPATMEQDPQGRSGYVQQALVIKMAEEAGFEFVAASEINANPKDTADHPFGVWTLPPVSRKAPRGEEADPNFDGAKYEAIGESDRMTLKFRKPA